MGNWVSGLIQPKLLKNKYLVLGLDAAGKTTIIYQLKLEDTHPHFGCLGFCLEMKENSEYSVVSWDIGVHEKIRPLFMQYYEGATHLIYVVDSNDGDKFVECKWELDNLLQENLVRDLPLLVFANKQDLPNSLSVSEITSILELENIPVNRSWYVQPCCATSGDGLEEGLKWISDGCPVNPIRFAKAKNARSAAIDPSA